MKFKMLLMALAGFCLCACATLEEDVDKVLPESMKPNVTKVSIQEGFVGKAGANEPVYEILGNEETGQTDMCVSFRNVGKKPAEFYVDGVWGQSETKNRLMSVHTTPIRVLAGHKGTICLEAPDLSGNIEFEGTIKY